MSFTYDDWMPSLTLRQIYSTENFYFQLYEKFGINGVSGGFATTKNFELSDRVNFKTVVKSNFQHYNLENVLTYEVTPNFEVDLKMVSFRLTVEILGQYGEHLPSGVRH